MLVDVRPFGDHLDLQLYRADFQVADKAVDDPHLLPGTSEQEVDGLDFQDFYIPAIRCVDDTVGNLFNRKVVLYGLKLPFLFPGR